MLVIKKRNKLIKSLSAGVFMFAVGLTGSVAYLDATTPSNGFASGGDKDALARTSLLADEAVASDKATRDQSTGATSSSSDQTGDVTLAPAPSGSGTQVTSETAVPVVDRTVPGVEAPYVGTPPDEEPSLVEGILNMLP